MSEASPQGGTVEAAVPAEELELPSRPRPKVLIPPVAARMPADPPSETSVAGPPQVTAPAGPRRAGEKASAPPKSAKVARPAEQQKPAAAPSGKPPSAGPLVSAPKAAPAPTPPARPTAAASLANPATPTPKAAVQTPPVVRTVRAPASRPGVARVFLTHLDPWSVMKQAFLLSLGLAVILLVAVAALWFALDSAGVFDALTRTATEVGGSGGSTVGGFLSFSKVMGVALLLAGIETILTTALITLFAFMYNLAVGIGGGLEVTLSEQN